MRLRRIEVEGFMPFRAPQVLDFCEASLFALMGPTGSGKSSLLDAVTFAFYGKTPRWGDKGRPSALVSQGLKVGRVCVEFEARAERYQVAREITLRKSQSSHEGDFRKWDGQAWRPVSSDRLRVRGMNQEIVRVLGMGYDTFVRTLLLPQGQFDQLLKPRNPSDRKELLIDLAGLSVYDRMFEVARRHLDDRAVRVSHLQGQLDMLEGCSPQALTEARGLLPAAREAESTAFEVQNEAVRRRNEIDARWKLQEDLGQAQELERRLETRKEAVEQDRLRLQRARRVLDLRTWLEALDRQRDSVRTRREELSREQKQRKLVQREHDEAESVRAQALRSAEELPRLEAREQVLTELLPEAKQHQALQKEVADLEAQVQRLQIEGQGLENGLRTLAREQSERLQLAENLERRRAELSLDEGERERVREGLVRARDLTSLRSQCADQRSRRGKLEGALRKAEAAEEKARQAVAAAEDSARQSSDAVEAARRRLERARETHAVAVLRRELRAGSACPVCLQEVLQVPEPPESPSLQAAEDELGRGTEELQRAQEAVAEAQRSRSAAERKSDLAGEQKKAADERLAELEAQEREKGEELRLLLGWPELPPDPETDLRGRWQTLESRFTERKELAERLERLQAQIQEARVQKAQLEEKQRHQREDFQKLTAGVGDRRCNLQEVVTRLSAVLEVKKDFRRELESQRRKLGERLKGLRQAQQDAEKRFSEAGRKLERAGAVVEERERSLLDAQRELEAQESALAAFLAEHGYRDESSLRRDLLSPTEIEKLSASVERYDRDCADVRARLGHLRQELGEERVTSGLREAAGTAVEGARAAYQQASHRAADLASRIQDLEHRLEQMGDLQGQLREAQEAHKTYQTLHSMLDASGLKQHVANHLLSSILDLASEQLETLSGRYRLKLVKGDNILVVDGWNGDETRDVKSLSGGETFLASLSLALALVDYLSEGTPLESLFIDEGFGTLDGETLEVVADTLERLQERGRLVGVITHVTELAERFPTRFEVEKAQGGSRVRVL